jgi:DNA primase
MRLYDMSQYDEELLKKIRSVTPQQLLNLDRAGRRIAIRCPIHKSRKNTPFTIYPKGDYCCYSCGAHGQNALDLLIQMGGGFTESVEELKKYI